MIKRFAGDALGNHTRPGEIASVHEFLDQGQTGLINDNDPTHNIHKGGTTFSAPYKEGANPLEGGAGVKQLEPMKEGDYQQFDQIHRQLMNEKMYGPPGMA